MVICPTNSAKESIRKYLGGICNKNKFNRIFTLLGTDGGLLKYLKSDATIYSAEKRNYIFRHQMKTFKNCKLFKGNASIALVSIKEDLDFIWLDFFGHCMDGDNLSSLVQASKKLQENGVIAITSKDARRKNKVNEYVVFRSVGLKIFDRRKYRNNGNTMNLYLLKANRN